jgi:hypothetical protein
MAMVQAYSMAMVQPYSMAMVEEANSMALVEADNMEAQGCGVDGDVIIQLNCSNSLFMLL